MLVFHVVLREALVIEFIKLICKVTFSRLLPKELIGS